MIKALSESTRRMLQTAIAACAVIGAIFLLLIIVAILPALETKAAPVVKGFRVDKADWLDRFRLQVFVRFDKRRPCKFVEQNWYAVHPVAGVEVLERIRVVYADRLDDEPTWSRPTGENRAGPWILHVSTTETPRYRTLIRHDCGMPWETETKPAMIDLSDAFAVRPP